MRLCVAILALGFAASQLHAQSGTQPGPATPPEIVKLRKARDQELQRSSIAALNAYIAGLKLLKQKAEKAYDVEEATAVQTALDKATSRLDSAMAGAAGRMLPAEKITELLFGGNPDTAEHTLRIEELTWGYDYTITFRRAGTFTCTGWFGRTGFWSIDDSTLTLVFNNSSSRYVMIFPASTLVTGSIKGRITEPRDEKGTRIKLSEEK